MPQQYSFNLLTQLPKIELHRHLEGSLRLETLADMAMNEGVEVPAKTVETLRPHVQVVDDTPNFHAFLHKFFILRRFYHSPEAIRRFTKEAIADAAADNIRYMELRFSPQALVGCKGFALEDVTDWVIEATQEASLQYDIQVNLIIAIVRHEPLAVAERVAQIAADRRDKGIVALDLTGDETTYPSIPFAGIFHDARKSGLHITVHAGEGDGAHSVRHAVEVLGASRIGHGVRVVEDRNLQALVRERNIPLEMCLTSNVQTAVVPCLKAHPLRKLFEKGILVTINTDDPSVSNINLTQELYLAHTKLGMSFAQLETLTHQAINASFLSASAKMTLANEFRASFANKEMAKVF